MYIMKLLMIIRNISAHDFLDYTGKHVRYNQINIRDRLLCNRFGNQYWLKNVIRNISKYSFFLF